MSERRWTYPTVPVTHASPHGSTNGSQVVLDGGGRARTFVLGADSSVSTHAWWG
jgi:hypothetical protein